MHLECAAPVKKWRSCLHRSHLQELVVSCVEFKLNCLAVVHPRCTVAIPAMHLESCAMCCTSFHPLIIMEVISTMDLYFNGISTYLWVACSFAAFGSSCACVCAHCAVYNCMHSTSEYTLHKPMCIKWTSTRVATVQEHLISQSRILLSTLLLHPF